MRNSRRFPLRQRSQLLLLFAYGFAATLAVFYGLVVRQDLIVTFFAFHILVCMGIPLVHGWLEGNLLRHWKAAWGRFEPQGARLGLLLGAILMVGLAAGLWLLIRAEGRADSIRGILQHWGLEGNWVWLFCLYLVAVNSLLEELMWRGFVLQRLQLVASRPAAVLLSSFFYSLYHLVIGSGLFGLVWGIFITLLVFASGVLWGWMKGLFPEVYPTWFSHLLADAGIALIVLWIFRS